MRFLLQSRLARLSIIALLGVVIAAGIAAWQIRAERAESASGPVEGVAGASAVGGPFELVTHNGEEVTQADFNDKPKLIFFGFTHCPSICPMELQKMAAALEELGSERAKALYPLFITIDPQRDTPQQMKDYVEMFDDRLIGLTGTQNQIDEVKEEYKVYASRVDNDKSAQYTMDHSAYFYLMSAENELVKIFRRSNNADDIAEGVRSYLDKRDGRS